MNESVFNLEVGLHRLMVQRDDLIDSLPLALTTDEQVRIGNAIEALEGQIRDHAKPTAMAKVNNFIGYYRHREMKRDAARKEKQRQAANEKAEDDVLDFMKRIAAATMEATGKERLEGTLGHIRLQTNGGPEPPPLISQPELVPPSLCTWKAELSWSTLSALFQAVQDYAHRGRLANDLHAAFTRVPSPALIQEMLRQSCPDCDGTGQENVEAPGDIKCSSCGGTGTLAVAGCSLQRRGQHVRIS